MDSGNHCIRKINIFNKIVTTIAGNGKRGFKDGNSLLEAQFNHLSSLVIHNDIIYIANTYNDAICKIENGIVSTIATGFNYPHGITIDNNGNILIADYFNQFIKRIDISGNINTFPRSCHNSFAIKVDSDGKIYVSHNNGKILYWNEDD